MRAGPFARALVLLLSLTAGRATAQIVDELFDDGTLRTLAITIHSRDWEVLRENYASNEFYPCDVVWNGVRLRNVGVRSRGAGSRHDGKPGLELAFDRYVGQQRFAGLQSVVLDNLVTDPSMLREHVAMNLLRRIGLPAPRETNVRLEVNGRYAGLYTAVEPVDEAFVRHHLGTAGTLFEFRWRYPFYATYPGSNLDVYRDLFAARGAGGRSTFDLYAPIEALFGAINDTPDDRLVEDVGARLDLSLLVRLLAADALLAEADGVLGDEGMNNFYLHRPPVGPAAILTWDKDHSFSRADMPLLAGAGDNVLTRRIFAVGEYQALFVSALELAVTAADGWLDEEIERQYEQIRDAALADPVRPFTRAEFEDAVVTLKAIAHARPAFARRDLPRLQRAWAGLH